MQAVACSTWFHSGHYVDRSWPGSRQSRGPRTWSGLTKPFSIRELLARVKAVLRRTAVVPKHQNQHSFGDVEVDLRRHRVLRSGTALDISTKEFELLKYFICHSGETLSRDHLLEEVWGYENYPTTRTVDTHLVRLRQKLEPDPEQPQYFLTVHGTGYRFVG